MKRIAFFITILTIFLASCSGKAYDEALQKGYHHLEKAEYEEASNQFTLALEKKETEEAEKALRIADAMYAGWDAIRAGTFNSAVEIAHNVSTDIKGNEAARIVIKDAEKLLEQAEALLDTYENIVAKMDEADLLFDNKSYEDALVIYEEVAEMTHEHFVIEGLISKAADKADEVKVMMENEDSDSNSSSESDDHSNENDDDNQVVGQDSESNSNNDKDEIESDDTSNSKGNNSSSSSNNNSSSGSSSKSNNKNKSEKDNNNSSKNTELTKANAEQIIRQGVGVHDGVNVKVDHEDNGYYVIQVYEVVGEGEGSHTATWGWYKVNKKTGDWQDAF